MPNLCSISLTILILVVALKVIFYSRRKKRGSRVKGWVFRFKLIGILLLTGMFWVPATLIYSVKNPGKAVVYVSRLGFSAMLVKKDIKRTGKRISDKLNEVLEPITPGISKKIWKGAKRNYTRYGAKDTQEYTMAVGNQVRGDWKPQPSLFTKIGRGVCKIAGKVLFFWR